MLAYPQSPPKPPHQVGTPMASPRKGVASPYQHQRGPSVGGRTPISDMMAHASPTKLGHAAGSRQSSYGFQLQGNYIKQGTGATKSPGKENSPHPDSPSMDRWEFPSAQGQAKAIAPLSPAIGTPQPASASSAAESTSRDYHPESERPSGNATVTRGRAVRRREPLKGGDELAPDGSSGTSPQKKMASRPRMASGGNVSSGSIPTKARTISVGSSALSKEEIDADFINLLSQMEVSSALRSKLVCLESTVKLSMLKGKETLTLASLGLGPVPRPSSPAKLRSIPKSHSSGSSANGQSLSLAQLASGPAGDSMRSAMDNGTAAKQGKGNARNRASSISSLVPSAFGGNSSVSGSGNIGTSARETPSYFATLLKANEARLIDVAQVKRMRAVLATESPRWITEFAEEEGGYKAVITRTKELLSMEWREEQHDDNLLHEFLRCFVVLSTTARGKSVLRSHAPTPFVELVDMLFSEKRPGDLSTRKLIIELLLILAELDLPAHSVDLQVVYNIRQTSSCLAQSIAADSGLSVAQKLLLCLVHNPRDLGKEAMVDFISATHTPRPFKTYLSEVCGVARDYFWIFCHGQNRYWRLEEVDVRAVEGPQVPGGMTGGVEFEAMAYLTSNVRLLNAISRILLRCASSRGNANGAAHSFHSLLFSSGLERLLAVLRRSSQVYYQPLHLELSRFLDLCERSGYVVPGALAVWHNPSSSEGGWLSTPNSPKKSESRPVPRPPSTAAAASVASPSWHRNDHGKEKPPTPYLPSPVPSTDDEIPLSALAAKILTQQASSSAEVARPPLGMRGVSADPKGKQGQDKAPQAHHGLGIGKGTTMTTTTKEKEKETSPLKDSSKKPELRTREVSATAASAGKLVTSPRLVPTGMPLPSRTPPSAASAPRFPNPYDSSEAMPAASHALSPPCLSPPGGMLSPDMFGPPASRAKGQPQNWQNSLVGNAIQRWEQRVSSPSPTPSPLLAPSPALTPLSSTTKQQHARHSSLSPGLGSSLSPGLSPPSFFGTGGSPSSSNSASMRNDGQSTATSSLSSSSGQMVFNGPATMGGMMGGKQR